ncbi:MAG: hypothetical protein WC641_02185 [Patescibacteria group bacterium]
MGLFDRLLGKQPAAPEKKPAAAKVEQKLPPAMPGQAEALIKEGGRIKGLRPDMPYIKVSEAKAYVSAKRQDLIERTKLADKSGFDFKTRENYLSQVAAEGKALDEFEKRIAARVVSGKEAAYEGKADLVENPEYVAAAKESSAEDLSKMQAELAELKQRQAELNKQREQFMNELKGLSAEQSVGTFYKQVEESKIPEAQFPNYFSPETPQTVAAELEASRRDIGITEAGEKKRAMSEPLRKLLDELDEVNEKTAALERNVNFAQRRQGPDRMQEAA